MLVRGKRTFEERNITILLGATQWEKALNASRVYSLNQITDAIASIVCIKVNGVLTLGWYLECEDISINVWYNHIQKKNKIQSINDNWFKDFSELFNSEMRYIFEFICFYYGDNLIEDAIQFLNK